MSTSSRRCLAARLLLATPLLLRTCLAISLVPSPALAAQDDQARLARELRPLLACLSGQRESSHNKPAAERPYVRLDLKELLKAFAEVTAVPGATFAARDTLEPGIESSVDAQACLDGLVWPATDFQVRCENARERCGDLMIQFPSPVTSGDAANDVVTMEWYMARDKAKVPLSAPAVVVVHESGSGMTAGRMFAGGLRMQGFHAFMIQLPYYGERRANGKRPSGENLVPVIRQAVADVRRARDAVAALPLVDRENISLQGTSLGGFVTATAASLDNGYDRVFIMLAGGGLLDVIQNGRKDAAKFREELTRAGLTGDKLESLVATIEPLRIAHRLDPATTWLYSAQFDTVVPPANSKLLAKTARLDPSHHIEMLANHYSGVIYVPYLLTHMQQQIQPSDIDKIENEKGEK